MALRPLRATGGDDLGQNGEAAAPRDEAGDSLRAGLEAGRQCLDAALFYRELDWCPLCLCPPDHVGVGKNHGKTCRHPGKRPWHFWKEFQDRRPTEQELRDLWKKQPNANVRMALGPVSGLVRVDVEGVAGEAKLAELSAGDLPGTLEFVSGRTEGGRGLLFKIPPGVELRTTAETLEPNQEVRFQARGAQTVLPPSRHASGRRYTWKPGHGPGEIEPALMPRWLIEVMRADGRRGNGTAQPDRDGTGDGDTIPEGSRDSTLTSLAGGMRKRGMTEAEIVAALEVVNRDRCQPPLPDSDVVKIARSVARYEPDALAGVRIKGVGGSTNGEAAAEVKARIEKLPGQDAAEAALTDRDLINALLRLERQDAAAFALAREKLRQRGVKVGVLDGVLKATRRQAGPQNPGNPGNPCSAYLIRDGCLCQRKNTNQGEVIAPLGNFVAAVTESLRVDDGSGEVEHQFKVEGKLADGTPLPPVAVKATDFARMDWPLSGWGLRAIVSPGLGSKDHLRAAIQEFSKDAAQRTVYKHTGWREVDGQWVYLHGDGAIGAGGVVEGFTVVLDDRLRHYRLPPPPTGEGLVLAVRASLGLRNLCPRTLPSLLGAVYRSILGPTDSSVALIGRSGLGKSELVALIQQHFGPAMVRLNLPGNWSSTANALEALAFLVKDAVLVIDEFKPGHSRYEAESMHAKGERVLRAQGNWTGRQRCRPDGSVRPSREPRGLIVLSGEDTPKGESLQSRIVPIQAHDGDFTIADLLPYQRQAAAGTYAQATAGFVQWLASRYADMRANLVEEHAQLRQHAMDIEAHPRVPGAIADLALGWKYFLAFALEVGAIAAAERDELLQAVWASLIQGGKEQSDEIAARNPARRFLELIASAISSRRVHLTNQDGVQPQQPLSWGYEEREYFAGRDQPPGVAYEPQGRTIGYVDDDNVYLDPETAYAEAMKLGEEAGDRLAVSKDQLFRRLKEQDYLASFEDNKTQVRRVYQGRKKFFLHLRRVSLSSPEQGKQGFQGPDPEKPEGKAPVPGPCLQGSEGKQGPENEEIHREKPFEVPEIPVSPVRERGERPQGEEKNADREEGTL
jgi:hypothetical protein